MIGNPSMTAKMAPLRQLNSCHLAPNTFATWLIAVLPVTTGMKRRSSYSRPHRAGSCCHSLWNKIF